MATVAERLHDAPKGCDDYVDYLTALLDAADPDKSDDATFSAAFRFIERNAQADLGNPGPLVHFLERHYPRYCRHLVESVRRHPTTYTLWMLNRILNGRPSDQQRAELLELLAAVAGSQDGDPNSSSRRAGSGSAMPRPASPPLRATSGGHLPRERGTPRLAARG